jgi:C4-dicarboxylate transporter DctM subunit
MPAGAAILVFALSVVFLLFVGYKRPIYESLAVSFLFVCIATGSIARIPQFLWESFTFPTLYALIGFMFLAHVLKNTGIIQRIINMVLAAFGTVRGGVGYVTVVSCALLGSMMGSVSGVTAATGTILIPAMTASKWSRESSVVVTLGSATLAPMIPPSSTFLNGLVGLTASLAVLGVTDIAFGKYYMACLIVGIFFVVHRLIHVGIMAYLEGGARLTSEEIRAVVGGSRRDAIRKGLPALVVILAIVGPFIAMMLLEGPIKATIGDKAYKIVSNALWVAVPPLAAVVSCIIGHVLGEYRFSLKWFWNTCKTFGKSAFAPGTAAIFGYALAFAFTSLKMGPDIVQMFQAAGISGLTPTIIFVIVTATLLTTIMSGSAAILLMSPVWAPLLYAAGMTNPYVIGAFMVAATGGQGEMIPPHCTGLYVGAALADVSPWTSFKKVVWFLIGHFLLLFPLGWGLLNLLIRF